jgi:hypothetical protein
MKGSNAIQGLRVHCLSQLRSSLSLKRLYQLLAGHNRTSAGASQSWHETLLGNIDSEPHGWYLLRDGDHLLL